MLFTPSKKKSHPRDYLCYREISVFFHKKHTLIHSSEGHKRSWCRFAFDGHCVTWLNTGSIVGVNGHWNLKQWIYKVKVVRPTNSQIEDRTSRRPFTAFYFLVLFFGRQTWRKEKCKRNGRQCKMGATYFRVPTLLWFFPCTCFACFSFVQK